MKTINLSYPLELPNQPIPKAVAAIGFFDGIHKGHQRVIKSAVKKAKKMGIESAVITFHPHPSAILKQPKKPVQYITPFNEKERLLQELEVDRLYIIEFSKELSQLKPQEFIKCFIKGLNIKHLIAGFDFTYGYKGAGNMDNIGQFAEEDFTFEAIEKVEWANEKVSSTKIRQLLGEGNINEVTQLLGRELTTTGIVVEGDKRGRTIGFPTANLKVSDDYLLPRVGVYAVKVCYKNQTYNGMANLGKVPTFKTGIDEPSLEVYILDFEKSIYGEELVIKWHDFIRDEQRFTGVDALVSQLNKDEKTTRQYFKESVKVNEKNCL